MNSSFFFVIILTDEILSIPQIKPFYLILYLPLYPTLPSILYHPFIYLCLKNNKTILQ